MKEGSGRSQVVDDYHRNAEIDRQTLKQALACLESSGGAAYAKLAGAWRNELLENCHAGSSLTSVRLPALPAPSQLSGVGQFRPRGGNQSARSFTG